MFVLAYGTCTCCGKLAIYVIEASNLREAAKKYADRDERIKSLPDPSEDIQFIPLTEEVLRRLPSIGELLGPE